MNLTSKEKRDFVRDDYNAIAQIYTSEDKKIKLYSKYIDEFTCSLTGKNVLDIGSSSGDFSNYLASSGLNVTGLDFSEKSLDIAKSRYKNVNFICSDITDFIPKEKFDGIFSKDTLFHLPDEDLTRLLLNLHKMLTSDGKILIILDIPKEGGEKIYDEPLDTRFKLYYNYLTEEKITGLLTNSGFKIDKVEYINDKNLYVYAKGIMAIYASK